MKATPRQTTIVALAAEGLADKQIATRLGLSVNTVRTHLERLFRENDFSNRAEAVGAWVSQEAQTQGPAGEDTPESHGATGHSGIWRRPRFTVLTMVAALLLAAIAVIAGGRQLSLTGHLEAAPPDVPSVASQPATVPDPLQAQTETPPAAPALAVPSSQPQPTGAPRTVPAPALPAPAVPARLPEPAQLALVNADRAGAGLPPLTWSPCLAGVAADAARQLAAQGALASLSLTVAASTCAPGSAGNAISGYWPSVNDGAMNSLFMSAPAQKAVILGNYHQFGAAWVTGTTGVAYAVFEFTS